jgi:Cu-Zn family superoxide dismutase
MHRSIVGFALAVLALSCTKSATTTTPSDGPQAPEGTHENPAKGARAELQSPGGIVGTLVFRETSEGLAVDGSITGLTPGAHGFHVHDVGECAAPTFESAGPHFDPTKAPHAGPTAASHHLGDLGNIDADEAGRAEVHAVASELSLDAAASGSILGRSIVVHAKADDMQTQPSGDSGDRIACGVIVADAS